MKILALLVVSINISTASFSQDLATTMILKLNGKIKSVTEYSFDVVQTGGTIQKGKPIGKDLYYYNKDGNLTEELKYHIDKSITKLVIKNIYLYDAKGNKTSEINYTESNGKMKMYEKRISVYDTKNNLIEYATGQGKYTYLYDTANHLIGTTGNNGKFKTKNTLDNKGRVIEVFSTDEKGKLQIQSSYVYDDMNNKVENKEYREGNIYETGKYKFENNKLIENSYYQGTKLSSKFIYKYNDKGKMIAEIEYYGDGKEGEKTLYQYDSDGNLIQYNSFGGYNEYMKLGDFDKNGNWLKRIFTIKEEPMIIERKIEYTE